MRFYEMKNFVRNKGYKLYDDAKVAALNEMYVRAYVKSMEVEDGTLYFMVEDWNDEGYEDAVSVKEFLELFRKLEADGFDGEVKVSEIGDFGYDYKIRKPKVSDEDYVMMLKLEGC